VTVVVLLSPDIDPGVFRSQAEAIGRLPEPLIIFTSRNDPALQLSARLTGHPNRLGNLSSIADVAGLDVTVIDLTSAEDADLDHLVAPTSPSVIGFLKGSGALRRALESDASGRIGLLPGTVLLAQEATTVILAPAVALEQELR
jgi:esterase/lipase superfamily enzyme